MLVDNASTDGVLDRVETAWPDLKVIRSERNVGYGAANNLALHDRAGIEYVGLVNPDAFVPSDWLRPLVRTLTDDRTLGAACPKIILTGQYTGLSISSRDSAGRRPGRHQGVVRISGVRVDGHDVTERARVVSGEEGRDPVGHWIGSESYLRVPIDSRSSRHSVSLRLDAHAPTIVNLRSGSVDVRQAVSNIPNWYECRLDGAAVTLVNNVGTNLVEDGYAADRGWLDVDDGQFDLPSDVFAWCGASVLLRGDYLDDVGLFDERLFLYYEDVELAWRGRSRGWNYRLAPTSVVAHDHSTSTVEGSALFDHLNERNHLLVVTRHGSPGLLSRAWSRHVLVTMSYARRDLIASWLRGRSGNAVTVRRRIRAFAAALRFAPGMLRSRAHDARRRIRPRR